MTQYTIKSLEDALIEMGFILNFTQKIKLDFEKAMIEASKSLADTQNGSKYLKNAAPDTINSWFMGKRYPKDAVAITAICEHIFKKQENCSKAAFNKKSAEIKLIIAKRKPKKQTKPTARIDTERSPYDIKQQNIQDVLGVDELKDNPAETLTYKKNLSEQTLKYISRSAFKELQTETSDTFQTEKEIYESIFFKKSEKYGAFIHGEGGIGKTRLMLELGRKAQKEGWKVYHILRVFEGWNTLQLPQNEKYCFVFDYVEENAHYTLDIADILSTQYPTNTIKIIANARESYVEQNGINDVDFLEVDLNTINNNAEKNYQSHVTREIIKTKRPDLFTEDSKFDYIEKWINRPSFAVFFLEGEELQADEETKINDAFDFNTIKHFDMYIKKRLLLTFRKNCKTFEEIKPKVFYLLSSLPLENKKNYKEITRLLIADGWINFDNNDKKYKSAYNDTIIDELLISYLKKGVFSRDHELHNELESFFKFAVKHSEFEYTFRSFDRVSTKSRLENKEQLLIDIFNENKVFIDEIRKICITFTWSKLIPNYTYKIIFINQHNILSIHNSVYLLILSKAVDSLHKESSGEINTIHILLNDNRPSLINWINSNRNSRFFYFKVSKYLKVYESISQIDNSIAGWINNNEKNIGLICKYLFYGGNFKSIKRALEKKHSQRDYQTIKKFINKLTKRGYSNNSFYPLIKLINEEIETLPQWINNNTNHKNFALTAIDYLQQSIDITAVKGGIELWINKNLNTTDDRNAVILASNYLKKVSNINFTKKTLEEWINNTTHTNEEDFVFIVSRYLKNTDDLTPVKNKIENWIINNTEYNRFQYSILLSNYLQKSVDISKTQSSIELWINNNNQKIHKKFLFNYLEKADGIEKIKETICLYFKQNPEYKNFRP